MVYGLRLEMTLSNVTKDNIESQTYANILTIIDNRTNIADPRGLNQRTMVYNSDPYQNGICFSDFPYIILELPTLEYSNFSCDGKHKTIGWKQMITIRTLRSGASNSSNSGKTDILTMGDSLNKTFNSETIKASLRLVNMYKMNLTKLDSDQLTVQKNSVYESTYELTYETRMKVSS